jgi:hypothetical protein
MTIDTHIGPATAIAVFGWHEQRLEGVGFVPVAPWIRILAPIGAAPRPC